MLENKWKTDLVNELKFIYPGSVITHFDPNEIQGMPDLLILYKDRWAALEGKQYLGARQQPNQAYYIDKLNNMSFARFIYPENKEEVLYELQRAFESSRIACIPKCK